MDEDPTTETKNNHNILTEWSLFWNSLKNDKAEIDEDFDTSTMDPLTLTQIKEMTRSLSQDRRRLNQKIEALNKEIEFNSGKLEALWTAGISDEATTKKINELSDYGQKLSDELIKLDEKLKSARQLEEEVKSS